MTKYREIRIVGDGTPSGTRIIDVESGQELACTEVNLFHNANEIPIVEIKLVGVRFSLRGQLQEDRFRWLQRTKFWLRSNPIASWFQERGYATPGGLRKSVPDAGQELYNRLDNLGLDRERRRYTRSSNRDID